MSVLIKGMQMPEDCFSCPLKEEGFCNITNAYAGEINERNSDCSLVELPEHHGRLIDADEVTNKYGEWYTEEGSEEGFIGTIKDVINLVPTVIKSE